MLSLDKSGKLYIVGIGPGDIRVMTRQGVDALCDSEYIIGNDFYLGLIEEYTRDKKVIRSCMGKEIDRAQQCVDLAGEHIVSIVSGGDPGVYGMASIVLEVIERSGAAVDVEIIPGVTATTAAASRIGSPLSGDYVTLSLSDLLTPLEIIQKRLNHAFRMGVPVALYNPRSQGRPDNLALALSIAGQYLRHETPVAVVKNASRKDEEIHVVTLRELFAEHSFVDMRSIVIIGGPESRIMEGSCYDRKIITPRGYDRKYVY